MYIIAIKDENPKNLVGYRFWNGFQVAHDNTSVPDFAVPIEKSFLKAVVYTSQAYAENNISTVKGVWKRYRRFDCEVEVISAADAVALLANLK